MTDEHPLTRITTPGNFKEHPDHAETLTERAYTLLEEQIVTLQLLPGEVLSEAALTTALGIGRTPVREALQRLALEGLVVILPRRGILVSEINVRSQLELLRVRREIERLMARLAAVRANEAERMNFNQIAEAMKSTIDNKDDVEFMRLDQELNHLISTSCRNEYARKAMNLMHGLARRFWYQYYKETLDLPRCARLHMNLAQAITRGNADEAAAASDTLMDYVEEFTRATLETSTDGRV